MTTSRRPPAHNNARARAPYTIEGFFTTILQRSGLSMDRLACCYKRGVFEELAWRPIPRLPRRQIRPPIRDHVERRIHARFHWFKCSPSGHRRTGGGPDFRGVHRESAVPDGRRGFGAGADRPQHAAIRRLGHRAPGWRRLPGKISPQILDDRGVVPDLRGARLGGADSHCALHGPAMLGHRTLRSVGRALRPRAPHGLVLGHRAGHRSGAVSLHPHPDPGRDSYAGHYPGVVEPLARYRGRRAASDALGHAHVGLDGNRAAAEGADRRVLPHSDRPRLPWLHQAVAPSKDLGAAAAVLRHRTVAGDCRTLARAGYAAQPSLFRFHHAQREGLLPWVLLVLLHQRARSEVSEPALSAGLQHRAAGLVLVVSPAVAVSVERVFSSGAETELP